MAEPVDPVDHAIEGIRLFDEFQKLTCLCEHQHVFEPDNCPECICDQYFKATDSVTVLHWRWGIEHRHAVREGNECSYCVGDDEDRVWHRTFMKIVDHDFAELCTHNMRDDNPDEWCYNKRYDRKNVPYRFPDDPDNWFWWKTCRDHSDPDRLAEAVKVHEVGHQR